MADLEQLLTKVKHMIWNREYEHVITAIEPIRETRELKSAEATDTATHLLMILGIAYLATGAKEAAQKAFSSAEAVSDDSPHLSLQATLGLALSVSFEQGDFEQGELAEAINFAEKLLVQLGSVMLTDARPPRRLQATEGLNDFQLALDPSPDWTKRPRREEPNLVMHLAVYLTQMAIFNRLIKNVVAPDEKKAAELDEAYTKLVVETKSMLAVAREIFEAKVDCHGLKQIFDCSRSLAMLENDASKAQEDATAAHCAQWIAGSIALDYSIASRTNKTSKYKTEA